MSDEKVTALPTKPDELLAALEAQMKFMRAIPQHAATVAKARRSLFIAYMNEGFTEAQALELCKGSMI